MANYGALRIDFAKRNTPQNVCLCLRDTESGGLKLICENWIIVPAIATHDALRTMMGTAALLSTLVNHDFSNVLLKF